MSEIEEGGGERPAGRIGAGADEPAPSLAAQRAVWEKWSAEGREHRLTDVSIDQRDHVVRWLQRLGRNDLEIIEVGCGAGWLCPSLADFGRLTATDLSADVVSRAQARLPDVAFVAGDLAELPFEEGRFDVAVSLEMLAHIADQPAFIAKLARIIKPDGMLMLATQNRQVLERLNNVPPADPGQIRKWVDEEELRALLAPHFDVWELKAITPKANRWPWRLVSNSKIDPVLPACFGEGPKRLKERLGWGWTLMTLARKLNL